MSSKAKGSKGNGKAKNPRPGVQIVLRTPVEVKDLLHRMARAADVSMNKAASDRLATGRWPAKSKERS